ncbi:MAG TPA: LysM peptidoglycan-binding domain-containing protein [Ktedonobacteraceae bacterium]
MGDAVSLKKAQIRELESDFTHEKKGGKTVDVQFNPETLKLSYSNQSSSSGSDNNSNTKPKQFVGGGTTKLSLQLWFDVSATLPQGKQGVDDVRKLTSEVVYFITPQGDQKAPVPPGLRFVWGTLQFDGVVESLEESLEFFSPEGKPLRASMSLNLSGQKMLTPTAQSTTGSSNVAGPGAATPGTVPLSLALAGSTLQNLTASAGQGTNWQAVAAANGIDNPRLLQPGQLLNLNPNVSGTLGISVTG